MRRQIFSRFFFPFMDIRKNQLELLSKRIEEANDRINSIISKLGWQRKDLCQNKRHHFKKCPINKKHKVLINYYNKHYKRCSLKSNGIYTKKRSKEKNKDIVKKSLAFHKSNPPLVSFITKKPAGSH